MDENRSPTQKGIEGFSLPVGLIVEREKIRELASVTRAAHSEYGLESTVENVELLVAPITYPVVLDLSATSSEEILTRLNCNMGRVLHGEESYEYPNGPLTEGQVLAGEISLLSDYIRKNRSGDDLRVLKFRTEMWDATSGLLSVAVNRTVIERL